MRHQNKNKTLGREKGPRTSLFRNLTSSLFLHESVKTTLAKAKAIRPYAEKLLTKAKVGDLHSRRQVLQEIHDKDIVQKLFTDISKRISSRNGGYTRIIKTGVRIGDGAEMAIFELVDKVEKTPIVKSKKVAKVAKEVKPEGEISSTKAENFDKKTALKKTTTKRITKKEEVI